MEKGTSFEKNIKFLISLYERELKWDDEGTQELPLEVREAYESFIVELETILKLSK